jgi:acyl-[acyl carrier protein]--UDP-N-acetylglucosamine O-acyltransferase
MAAAERRILQDAYRLLYRSGLTPRRALARMREELPACPPLLALLDFLASVGRHGICKGPRASIESADDPEEVTS